jgi:Flp pilus assembly protein TadD
MSKLGDLLHDLDRKRRHHHDGLGDIAGLTEGRAVPARWRPAALLVIVAAMLAVPIAMAVHSRRAAPPPASHPALAAGTPAAFGGIPNQDRVRALLEQGTRIAQLGDSQGAERLFREALRLSPRDSDAWNDLGVVLVRQGQPALAVEAFLQAVRVDPNQLEAHRNLAIACDREGRFADAASAYRTFLRLSPADHPARDDVRRRLTELSNIGSGQ